jgi:DNA-binding MurR/RpiR family transcriptional regulator
MHDLGTRIEERAGDLPPAERRIAEVILSDPTAAAFATVAALGRRAGTSGATVVRLAERLGYGGWTDLQAQVRRTLDQQLRPATERIREVVRGDVLAETASRDADNVRRTLDGADRADFDAAVALLADRRRAVRVLAGTAEAGIGSLAADALDLLRPGVSLVSGSPVAVARQLAHLETGDVLLAIDLRRYERWVLDAAAQATGDGCELVAISDSRISPLARLAAASFVVTAEGAGPFDSHVGTLALVNALASGVARKLRKPAATRLDRVEAAWRQTNALTDG